MRLVVVQKTGGRMCEINIHDWKEETFIRDVETALREKQFYVTFQPIFSASSGRVVAAEALARWKHPGIGNVPPGVFVPLLEKYNRITELDYYIWERAMKAIAEMKEMRLPEISVSINVSRIDLFASDMLDVLNGLIEKYDIEKKQIILEITESAYMERPQEVILLTEKLKANGYALSMDDFGSGYSSLGLLKEMPVSHLKIDMSFMDGLESSRRAGIILINVIRMAKMLKLETIVEGVETEEQLRFLRNVGCEKLQGNFLSEPIARRELYKLLYEESQKKSGHLPDHRNGILLVDDVVLLRKALIDALGDTYAYFEAGDGCEALEILKDHASEIHMVITDIVMPNMDGFGLIKKIRENEYLSRMPIIVITANDDRENEIRALTLGAVDVIAKPFDELIVSRRVNSVLQISEMEWLKMEVSLLNANKPYFT